MDKVLVVVEAEKTHRDVVKRGYRELVGASPARRHGPGAGPDRPGPAPGLASQARPAEPVGARADVAVVLNKTRSYGPNWLEGGS